MTGGRRPARVRLDRRSPASSSCSPGGLARVVLPRAAGGPVDHAALLAHLLPRPARPGRHHRQRRPVDRAGPGGQPRADRCRRLPRLRERARHRPAGHARQPGRHAGARRPARLLPRDDLRHLGRSELDALAGHEQAHRADDGLALRRRRGARVPSRSRSRRHRRRGPRACRASSPASGRPTSRRSTWTEPIANLLFATAEPTRGLLPRALPDRRRRRLHALHDRHDARAPSTRSSRPTPTLAAERAGQDPSTAAARSSRPSWQPDLAAPAGPLRAGGGARPPDRAPRRTPRPPTRR